jgi:hypothetical protein
MMVRLTAEDRLFVLDMEWPVEYEKESRLEKSAHIHDKICLEGRR